MQLVAGGSGRVEDTSRMAQAGFHASLAWLLRAGMA